MIARRFSRGFDMLMTAPLVVYAIMVAALFLAMFTQITRESLRIAFTDPALRHSIWLSLSTSTASTLLSLLVAVPSGYILSRRVFRGHALVDSLIDLPIVLPPLVMGLAILIFFNTTVGRWLDRGLVDHGLFVYQPLGIVLAQFIVGCAFCIRVVKAGFDAFDWRYEETAMTLGANQVQCFFLVVIPNVGSSLVAGGVITWARIFGLFGPILLVAGTMRGKTEIMPTTIFLETSIGRLEVALVIAEMMVLISLATLILFKRLGGKGVAG
ncbi:MAG: ABC transporter permease [Kiritimatiellae bacterium]|nr:ABC transporter permease [Kiritimatiellia bacterium]